MRNSQGRAETGIGGVFRDVGREMRGAQAGGEREPWGNGELVFYEDSFECSAHGLYVVNRRAATTVVEDQAERLVVMLKEAVYARLNVIFRQGERSGGLATAVI